MMFVKLIEQHLQDNREYAAIEGLALPSEAAERTCMSLARLIADTVDLHSDVKGAAFPGDEGVVSLVLSTGARRVNYVVCAGSSRIYVHQIDEKMNSQTTDATIKDTDLLRQKAEWVAGDAT